MKLLAIDPSFVGSGITTYENGVYNYYIIKTDKQSKNSNDIIRRIIEIKKELYIIINRFNPDYVIIEGPSFGSRSSSLVQMGALNYSIREMLLDEGIKFIVSPPTVVKKYWTGKGNANKQLMIEQAYD
ncbi:MAG: crossover junction endodeoxyribonuclease RuvC, partial [Candidatus Woesearchaeota archaeon]